MSKRRQRIRKLGLVELGPGLTPKKLVSYNDFNEGTGPQPVVCARWADGPPVVPSVRDSCVRCGAVVWVSPATEASLPLIRAVMHLHILWRVTPTTTEAITRKCGQTRW